MPPKFAPTRGGAIQGSARDASLSRLTDKPKKESEKAKAPACNTRQSEKRHTHASQFEKENWLSTEAPSSDGQSNDSSSSPRGDEATTNPKVKPGEETIRNKASGVRESIRWQIEGAEKHYYDGLEPT